jgi:hypothetical protein
MLAKKQEIACNGNGLGSPREIPPTVDIQSDADAFATTHWSLVLIAQGQSVAAEEALEQLCQIYWRPLYAFARRQGCDPEEARDLTQGFFELLLQPHFSRNTFANSHSTRWSDLLQQGSSRSTAERKIPSGWR